MLNPLSPPGALNALFLTVHPPPHPHPARKAGLAECCRESRQEAKPGLPGGWSRHFSPSCASGGRPAADAPAASHRSAARREVATRSERSPPDELPSLWGGRMTQRRPCLGALPRVPCPQLAHSTTRGRGCAVAVAVAAPQSRGLRRRLSAVCRRQCGPALTRRRPHPVAPLIEGPSFPALGSGRPLTAVAADCGALAHPSESRRPLFRPRARPPRPPGGPRRHRRTRVPRSTSRNCPDVGLVSHLLGCHCDGGKPTGRQYCPSDTRRQRIWK